MSSLSKKLYRSLSRLLRDADRLGIPLVGVAQLPAVPISCNARSLLRSLFAAPHLAIPSRYPAGAQPNQRALTADDAFLALRNLRQQFKTLQGAEDHTRQALAQWRSLLISHCHTTAEPHTGNASSSVLRGAEEGAMLMYRLHRELDGDLFDDEELGSTEEAVSKTRLLLDSLAARVREARADLFMSEPGALTGHQRLRAQLGTISKVLFQDFGLRCEPVEWVYDGLTPLLLPELLLRGRSSSSSSRASGGSGSSGGQSGGAAAAAGRGVPLALALVYGTVSRRCGVPVSLVRVSEAKDATSTGPANLQGVPAEVASRQAGRTIAAPPVDTWVIQAKAPATVPVLAALSNIDSPFASTAAASTAPPRPNGEGQPTAAALARVGHPRQQVPSTSNSSAEGSGTGMASCPQAPSGRGSGSYGDDSSCSDGSSTSSSSNRWHKAAATESQQLFVDVSTKQAGQVLTLAEALQRFPHAQNLQYSGTNAISSVGGSPSTASSSPYDRNNSSSNTSGSNTSGSNTSGSDVSSGGTTGGSGSSGMGHSNDCAHDTSPVHDTLLVLLLSELVRTIVSAHQRRGESDQVAHWLYQLLALDPGAAEWGHVLQSDDVATDA